PHELPRIPASQHRTPEARSVSPAAVSVASLCFHPGAESGSRFQSGAFPVHRMQTRTLWLCLMPVCSLHILSWCVDVKMQGFQVLTEPQPVFNVAVLYVHGKWLQEQALNRPAGPVVSLANNNVLLHHG